MRNTIAVDNTEGVYMYTVRRPIPIGRRGSAESQLMWARLTWPARIDATLGIILIKWMQSYRINNTIFIS